MVLSFYEITVYAIMQTYNSNYIKMEKDCLKFDSPLCYLVFVKYSPINIIDIITKSIAIIDHGFAKLIVQPIFVLLGGNNLLSSLL